MFLLLVLTILLFSEVYGVTYYVSQDGRNGAFKTIMEAVRTAKAWDEIVILDKGVYREQVTIDSTKNGLCLRSESPKDLQKPTILYQDTKNIGPRTCDEAKDTSKITFDRNGALQILRAKWVRIEGLAIDGGGPFVFGADGIWKDNNTDCRWPLQYGNGAITLWVSGEIIIRDCDIRNAYFGINVKDRNEGGVFGNANPGDVYPENVVPFSAFAQTGNHLIEYNRIHNNCFGLFFESSWDMGSTIRYNLIYENHHPNASFANKVKNLSGDGGNHPGGAFFFKDNLLSPLAIYNNTFWHNFLIFVGHWNPAGIHLIFNNIFGAPFAYWGDQTANFEMNNYQEMFGRFPYRMHNNVISAQFQRPRGTGNVQIFNNVQLPQTATEGTIITSSGTGSSATIIPQSANLRWLEFDNEVKFLSTDPSSQDFLVPDWGNSLVQQYIVDKGWVESGVRDFDGSIADIGAISMGGGRPVDVVTIKPTKPMLYQNNSVNLSFSITPRIGDMIAPRIVYIRFIRDLDTISNFGPESPIIPQNNIQTVTVPATPALKIGANEYSVSVQNPGKYAFFEIIVEGDGTNGQKFTSAVGFIPYRKLDYIFYVEVRDKRGGKKINEVTAGDVVVLYVEAQRITTTGTQKFTNKVDPTEVNLNSSSELLDPSGKQITSIPGGVTGSVEIEVMFTKVPTATKGIEYVHVSGKWINQNQVVPFLGSSEGILVRAGPPDSISFQDPPPKRNDLPGVVNMGEPRRVRVQAYDKYGNKVDKPTEISCISVDTSIIDVGSIQDIRNVKKTNTDTTGMATFYAIVTGGDSGQIVMIVATLSAKPTAKDTAYLKVGGIRDRLWIYYSDTASYNPTVTIEECAGIRVPVRIRVSKDGKSINKEKSLAATLVLSSGLVAYPNQGAAASDSIKRVSLVNGEAVIWIQATSRTVIDGEITVSSEDPTVITGERGGINFKACFKSIERAAYFADNGYGRVDRVEIYYSEALEAADIPDTLVLYWPSRDGESRVASIDNITLDAEDKRHITVKIPEPFNANVTKYAQSNLDLGTSIWYNDRTPTAPALVTNFAIDDSVGPLISAATVYEKLSAGNDTIILSFTESVSYEKLRGKSLILIKNGVSDTLNVIDSKPGDRGNVVVVIGDMGERAPVEGDSIKINPYGSVVDGFGNKAHLLNRPVVLTSKKVAPSIVKAIYRDSNADGIIETVVLGFNKSVDPTQMSMQFTFETEGSKVPEASRISYIDGKNNEVEVNIKGLFSNENKLKDKTSGSMQVTIMFMDYNNDKRSSPVEDGAAPVLVSVEYHYGKYLSENEKAPDTLYLQYSERLVKAPEIEVPVNFKNGEGISYTVRVIPASVKMSGDKYLFVVSGVEPSEIRPTQGDSILTGSGVVRRGGDSAWINADATIGERNAVDLKGNAQLNPANKRVAIKTVMPPFELSIKGAPNPFNPKLNGESGRFKIVIKPRAGISIPTAFRVSMNIYDKVGNLVKKIPQDDDGMYRDVKGGEILSTDSCVIYWDGTNRNKRVVGNGTYLGILKVWYHTQGTQPVKYQEKLFIGVKQQ